MEVQRDVVGHVMKFARTLRRMERSEKNESRGVVRLLYKLEQNNGLTAGELAELMDIRQPSLTELLNRLECNSIIRRVPDREDHRKVKIFILEEGLKIVERAKKSRKNETEYLNSILTEQEQQTFCDICEKMTHALVNLKIKEGGQK